jgi:hypothetical protein
MHGMSPLSPIGFVQYGNYLALCRGDFEDGYRYVKFALALMKSMSSRAHDGEIIWYSTHTRLYFEPMQSAVELYLDGHMAALKSGATRYALFGLYFHINFSFWSGKKLDVVVNSMKQAIKQTKYHRNLMMLELMLPLFRVCTRMMDQSVDLEHSDLTNVFGEAHKQGNIARKLPSHLLTTYFNCYYEGLIFRDLVRAKDYAEKYLTIQRELSSSTNSMMYPTCYRTL